MAEAASNLRPVSPFAHLAEWLAAGELVEAAVEALDGDSGSATDRSANRTTLELAGPPARAVLEKGCALDLHPRGFAVGDAHLTLIGSVPVIPWKTAAEQFRILPWSSFADFSGRWLIDAMAEFAVDLPVPEPV